MREVKHLSVHQWLRSAIPDSQQPISPIGFLFLKLPPPPCAVLLVDNYGTYRVYSLVFPRKFQGPNGWLRRSRVFPRFCDTELSGIKDPNRHSEDILQQQTRPVEMEMEMQIWSFPFSHRAPDHPFIDGMSMK